METNILDKKAKAKKRVEELKGFYVHLMVYVMVNTMITLVQVVSRTYNGESFLEAFWNFGTFSVWFFWGIGLAFHAIKVFNFFTFFGKDWEERQIQKYMEEERNEVKKYRQIGDGYGE